MTCFASECLKRPSPCEGRPRLFEAHLALHRAHRGVHGRIDLMKRGVLAHVDETLYYIDPQTGRPGQPYEQDFPWKHRVPLALIAGGTVVLWAKAHPTRLAMLDEEDSLNIRYRGEWAKEGLVKAESLKWAAAENSPSR